MECNTEIIQLIREVASGIGFLIFVYIIAKYAT